MKLSTMVANHKKELEQSELNNEQKSESDEHFISNIKEIAGIKDTQTNDNTTEIEKNELEYLKSLSGV